MNNLLSKLAVLMMFLILPAYSVSAATVLEQNKEKCNNGDFQACNALGQYYAYDPDAVLDFKAANTYFDKACRFGKIKEACDALVFKSGATSRIKSYRIPRDVVRAAKIYNYSKKETNYENLYELFKQYCDEEKDLRACAYCGEMKILGLGTNKTVNRGIMLLKQSCEEADAYACGNLGYRYFAADEVETDEFKAFNLLNYACNNGEFGACRYVAAFYENEIGVTYDKDKIEYLYTKSCDNADAVSCHKLGMLYLSQNSEEQKMKANQPLTTGCDYGSTRACSVLGDLYSEGINGVKKDDNKAYELYRRACDGSDAKGCYHLAECYAHGTGVKKSRNVAATLYVKACEIGSIKACEQIESVRKQNEKAQKAIAKEAAAQ